MIPAPTLEDVLRRAEIYASPHPLRDRLVSIVFAEPSSLVISDLKTNRVFWDEMTGESWDLFFAGYYAYGSHGDRNPIDVNPNSDQDEPWCFSPKMFRGLLQAVEYGGVDPWGMERNEAAGWQFSGTADLVSFMVYGGEPDWASLRAVELVGSAADSEGRPSLGRAIEGLRRDDPDPAFAPGEFQLGPLLPRESLRQALAWSASAAVAGFIGNRADAIISHLLH